MNWADKTIIKLLFCITRIFACYSEKVTSIELRVLEDKILNESGDK